MGTSSIRVLIVEDSEPFRRFLLSTLQNRWAVQDIRVVSDGLEAVREAQRLQPDLILLDIGLPTLNGIEAARRIRKLSPTSKIIFVTQESSADVVQEALSIGARGYVVKTDAGSELLAAVPVVLRGEQFVGSRFAGHDFTGASNSRTVDALSSNAVHTSESGNRVEDNPYLRFAGNALISEFLAAVIEATAADFGTVQLFDSINGVLRIVAQHGFQSEFLNYFDTVSHSKECVCGAAMKRRSRIVVTDIATDPLFSDESRGVLLRANVRSVQSTPLIDSLGKFVGMASTHYSRSNGITPDGLKQVDNFVASQHSKLHPSDQETEQSKRSSIFLDADFPTH